MDGMLAGSRRVCGGGYAVPDRTDHRRDVRRPDQYGNHYPFLESDVGKISTEFDFYPKILAYLNFFSYLCTLI